MHKISLIILAFMLAGITASAQTQFEVLPDNDGSKIFKGLITRDLLEKDTAFKWYAENLKGYHPNPGGLEILKKNVDSVRFIVFMGTWCEDSHSIVPKFFAFADAAGLSKDRVSLIGVDRSKKTLDGLSEALNIINVPTILVMKNGKEIGRIVEYGKYGLFDKEVGEIINTAD
jgi:thiol-disulfide isomerase/thioredoxin